MRGQRPWGLAGVRLSLRQWELDLPAGRHARCTGQCLAFACWRATRRNDVQSRGLRVHCPEPLWQLVHLHRSLALPHGKRRARRRRANLRRYPRRRRDAIPGPLRMAALPRDRHAAAGRRAMLYSRMLLDRLSLGCDAVRARRAVLSRALRSPWGASVGADRAGPNAAGVYSRRNQSSDSSTMAAAKLASTARSSPTANAVCCTSAWRIRSTP